MEAHKLFRKMEEDDCRPDGHNYNLIIQRFLLHKDLSTTTKPIHEMVDRGLTMIDDVQQIQICSRNMSNPNMFKEYVIYLG